MIIFFYVLPIMRKTVRDTWIKSVPGKHISHTINKIAKTITLG